MARCTIEKLLKRLGIEGIRRNKVIKITVADSEPFAIEDNKHKFGAAVSHEVWVLVFSYVSTWQGFAYVTFIFDLFARRIVCWKVSSHMKTQFVLDALEQALYQRRPNKQELIHHSDRGSQYTAISYTQRLKQAGIEPSVGKTGSAYDNALAKTINSLYKTELTKRKSWKNIQALELATLERVALV